MLDRGEQVDMCRWRDIRYKIISALPGKFAINHSEILFHPCPESGGSLRIEGPTTVNIHQLPNVVIIILCCAITTVSNFCCPSSKLNLYQNFLHRLPVVPNNIVITTSTQKFYVPTSPYLCNWWYLPPLSSTNLTTPLSALVRSSLSSIVASWCLLLACKCETSLSSRWATAGNTCWLRDCRSWTHHRKTTNNTPSADNMAGLRSNYLLLQSFMD